MHTYDKSSHTLDRFWHGRNSTYMRDRYGNNAASWDVAEMLKLLQKRRVRRAMRGKQSRLHFEVMSTQSMHAFRHDWT